MRFGLIFVQNISERTARAAAAAKKKNGACASFFDSHPARTSRISYCTGCLDPFFAPKRCRAAGRCFVLQF